MGFGPTELILILLIVLVLFGAKKLRNVGGDLGGAIKNFRQAVKEGEEEEADKIEASEDGKVIDAEFTSSEKEKV
ncbi:MAG: twin-arginine translocase TatA/TatE family subunit [Gammaproteobacteria bacterium]|nr:MAG: twin-arginine translocase TatA/TatE family subunit [Gammaproteobacteria bacterium]